MKLEELTPNERVTGVVPGELVSVLGITWEGDDAVTLTYKTAAGALAQRVLYRDDEPTLAITETSTRPFDADPQDFRLAAEAQRIALAGLFDPMLAVTTSDVQPLPHQIKAVYGEMLDRAPLRFLLADDPGAGKTIMAGLYVKELILRDDVKRCLIVAPGGLVDQWQDELYFKFGLRFEILTTAMADVAFEQHPLLIARMDQLARNEDLLAQLDDTEWDLVIVDEAHRLGAHYFGMKLNKTRRFQLGEKLRDHTRHFLLMTATPHAGKEEDFQLFLTLLDPDGFEGRFRRGLHTADTSGMMLRRVKEELLTFKGKPLFPERVAETIPYELSTAEQDLYEQVTSYVREGMNRAAKLDDKRRNTVGFALTVLQRRLASSPHAIYLSLQRRSKRLERRRDDLRAGRGVEPDSTSFQPDLYDEDAYSAEELEHAEEELLDSATAAQTITELEAELAELATLIEQAKHVRNLGTDKKWSELSKILEDHTLIHPDAEKPRKLIVFTEHRDTLDYLSDRIGTLFGKPNAVLAIHGGVRRADRRAITEEFTKNPDARVLLATDAAGEGLNLQAAHLVVNYDLPWNPNRIEQRFGRVHRIGQTEVCRLWNLVASDTREGAVFQRLLAKIEEQRKAYGGKVFDVLGSAFDETPLRDLLLEAIRYGDLPETRAKMERVIDARVSDGIDELLRERALTHDSLSAVDLEAMKRQMEEAKARRLQPHYIEWAFRAAFSRLGGRMSRREKGRYEISHVPAAIRAVTKHGPVTTRYERVTFEIDRIDVTGKPRADLLAPGHPLHDAVAHLTISQLRPALDRGTILVSPDLEEPQVLVGLFEEIADGVDSPIARRYSFAFVDGAGQARPAGPAPYLDFVGAPDTAVVQSAKAAPWVGGVEGAARSYVTSHSLKDYLAEVAPRHVATVERIRQRVDKRLGSEANRLAGEALAAMTKEQSGQRPKESSDSLTKKSQDLLARREARLMMLAKQAQISTKPVTIVTAALVLPLTMVEGALEPDAPMHAVETKEVERRGVEKVLATERHLGRTPTEQAFNNPGYDVLSVPADGSASLRIEVKARIAGADDFFVTHNEVLTAKNAAPDYRLALVRVSPEGAQHDEVRYLEDPFAGLEVNGVAVTGYRIRWDKTWANGREPF